jgi:hypothetical protein
MARSGSFRLDPPLRGRPGRDCTADPPLARTETQKRSRSRARAR